MLEMDLYIREVKLNREKRESGEAAGVEMDEQGDYPFDLPFIRNLDRLQFKSNVTFLVGENGTGKSTLMEAIAVNYGFNPEGGSKNLSFSTSDTHSHLHEAITLVKGVRKPKDGYFLRAESFYNVASEIDRNEQERGGLLNSYGGKSLHAQSHGESFMALILNRFWGNGLYLLDEPEAALSPQRQLALLTLLGDLVRQDSQFIIATHSPILLAFPEAQIYVLTENGIRLTPYKETEHYRLTKEFLDEPEAMLKHLMEKG